MKLTSRMQRLAIALMERPQTIRDLIDLIPSNNPAEYVKQLRRHGLAIPCDHLPFVTSDGVRSWHGRYHLTAADRQKLSDMGAEK